MKAIIAEIDKKHMIVITDKGDFVKVKRQMSAAIGDEIELKQRRIYPISKRLAGLAACFMACIFLSTGVYAYCTPYSYVSVDINPSLSLALNRFERVISVNPLTEDAVDLIKDAKSLKNRNIDAALSAIIKTASDKGYIDEETEDEIVVIVSAKDPKQEKKLEETVAKTAEKELSKVNKTSGVTVEKTNVENYKTAVSQRVSPGRMVLEENLKKVMPEIKTEEIKDMSVKEVANLIREKRKAAKEAEKEAEKAAREAEKENRKKNESFDNRKDREEDDKQNNKNWKEDNRKNRDDDKDRDDEKTRNDDKTRDNNKDRDDDKDREDDKRKDDIKKYEERDSKDDKITIPSNASDKRNNDNNKEPNKDKKRSNDTGNDDRDGSEDEREGGKKNKDDSNGDKKNNSQVRDKDKDNSSSNNDSQKKTNNSSSSNDSQEKVNNSKNSKSKIDNNGKINWNNWIYNFDWLNKNNDSDKNSRSRER